MNFDVVVIGAGAAGMMCAVEAGKRGRSVLVVDHAAAAGEKIRISGGGRCNFTNTRTSPSQFISSNPRFASSALRRYRPADFIAWIDRHGISTWRQGEVRAFDVETGTERFHFDSPEFSYTDLAFSPDGTRLALTNRGTALMIRDAATGASVVRVDATNFEGIGIAYRPDGRTVLVQSDHESVVFSSAGKQLHKFANRQNGINGISISPDRSRLAVVDSRASIHLWNIDAKQEIRQLTAHLDSPALAAFSHDNSRLVSVGRDGAIKIWDVNQSDDQSTIGGGHIVPGEWVPSVAFDRRGELVFAASDARTIRAFDLKTREPRYELAATGDVRSLAASPDGAYLAAAYDVPAGHLAIWNLSTRSEELWANAHDNDVTCVAYNPDGSRLASASSDGTAKVWDARTGRHFFTMRGHQGGVNHVAFHPNGRQMVTAGVDGTIRFWDAADGAPIAVNNAHPSSVSCLAFSPDGRQMATANDTRARPDAVSKIIIWDVIGGEIQHTLSGHKHSVWHLTYSPDGKRLASAGEDQTVKIWDPARGELRLSLNGHEDDVRCVAFSPDGHTLISSGDDPYLRVWDATPLK